MKRIVALAAAAITMAVLLCGCGPEKKTYDADSYMLEMDYRKDFTILQLTDIHIGNKDDRRKHYDYMDLIIDDADADMIVISGDIFTFATKNVAKEFFEYIDSHEIYWTVTFGNHDEQCYFSIDWLTGYLNNFGSYCLFKDIQDDDVYGNANFAINLMKDGNIKEQVIILDSNRYNFGEYVGYDYIKDSQVAWYENLVSRTTQLSGGKTVPSVMFFHIPLPEWNDAWDAAQEGSPEATLLCGEKRENVCCPDINSGLFDSVLKMGSTNGIFVGHDHKNNFSIDYKGVVLGYGITSTDRIYYEKGIIGGLTLTFKDDGTFDIDHIYHDYGEVE